MTSIKRSESLVRAQEKYQGKCKILTVRFNRETDADLIEWLNRNQGQASTKIKDMIRASL